MSTRADPVPDITSSPLLDALESQAVTALDAHLSPALHIRIEIGWWDSPPASYTSPALTQPATTTYVHIPGHPTRRYCHISIDEPVWNTVVGGNTTWQQEVVTHEVFHCYELQIEGFDGDPVVNTKEPWVQEGLARWIDMELYEPAVPYAVASLQQYFAGSTTPLFARRYDAVGFWGHLQDVSHDLWSRIPAILTAAIPGDGTPTVDTALKGINLEDFYDTWGSSAANKPAGGAAWIPVSPMPGTGLAASLHTVTPAGPDSPVSVKLEPFSTDQLFITMPAAPAGSVETARVVLGGAYGRFGVLENYTTSALTDMTFCGGPSGCKASSPPPAGGCGGGEVSVPPPPLTPLPSDPILAVAAADSSVTVTVEYTAIPLAQATSGTCEPGPPPASPGSGSGTGGSGGDPHLTDFDGYMFDFQAAGEFTLLKSTTDNLQIQVRQQPFDRSQTIAVNTAVAVRDGNAVVEVDAGKGIVEVRVNHKRFTGDSKRLSGGGSIKIYRAGLPTRLGKQGLQACEKAAPPSAPHDFCKHAIAESLAHTTGIEIKWKDGTKLGIADEKIGSSACLSLEIKVARHRLKHLTGLLGNADVRADQEFRGRDGTRYQAVDILNGAAGTALQANILYDEFGASWRITRHESLFTYTHGKSTASYTIANFPRATFNPASAPIPKQQQAAAVCAGAGAKNPAVVHDCEYDVLATGKLAFAGTAPVLQTPVSSYPVRTPPPPRVQLHPVDLGSGSSQPEVAYDPASGDTYVAWIDSSGSAIDVCAVTAAAPSCNGGAGPYRLVNPLAGSGQYFDAQVLVQPGGTVVVLAEIDGASAAAGYAGEGIVAWSSSAGGATFAGGTQGIALSGKLLAGTLNAGDPPSGGAVALDATDIGVYGDTQPFGSGFTDFSLTAPAPAHPPVLDHTGAFSNEGSPAVQLASVPDASAPGEYIVVAVGADPNAPAGCPSGSAATGFGVGVGTPAALQTQAAWSSSYFQTLACQASGPVLAGGGPAGGAIGVLEDEGAGLSGSGSNGVYYRAFNPLTSSFAAPVLVSDETSVSVAGADALTAAGDGTGGMYALWLDHRGYVLDYSSDAGAAWSGAAPVGLSSGTDDAVIAGAGQGGARIAYGGQGQEWLVPVSYAQLHAG